MFEVIAQAKRYKYRYFEDISKATLDIRKIKLNELKEKQQQGFIAYFSGTELVVKPRKNSSQQTKEAENNASKGKQTKERIAEMGLI